MAPVPLELAPTRPADTEEVVIIDDLDEVTAATNIGCGDDNPYN